jgi:glutamine amidotransferase
MCRLFVVSGENNTDVSAELSRFAQDSRVHKHGWGFADFSGGKPFVKREITPAIESDYYRICFRANGGFAPKQAFFHIRYATVGEVSYENVHPFVRLDDAGRIWSLIHNGTIFHGERLDKYFDLQAGSSDSERLLMYLVDCANGLMEKRKRGLTDEERFALIDDALRNLAGEHNKLNVAIFDGESFYLHANSRTGSKLLGDSAKNDYLYMSDRDGAKLFATAPLSDADWTPVPLNTLIRVRDGKITRTGKPHAFEYIEREDDICNLYREFSDL